ncbi:hypothetical protein C3Z09_09420 [Lelliottia aquatilis]|nr:hypothetical protein C3Z09_09420 [Lelliottia aquatilis]
MAKNELINLLISMNLPKGSYSIGSDKNESLCFIHDGFLWVVFYSERGQKTEPEYFSNEEEACDVFLSRLKKMLHIK